MGSKAEPWNQSVAIGEKCRNFIVLVLALFGLVPSVHSFEGAVSEDHAEITFQSAVLPFLAKNCFACHGNGESKADLSLDKYKDDLSLIKDRKVWDNVVNMLEKHEMPPKEEALIRMAQRIRHRRNCQTHIFV